MIPRALLFQPHFEQLERRDCPAVDVSIFGSTMIIRGDAGDDFVTISDDGQGNVGATIINAGGNDTDSASNIRTIVVYGNDGDDVVNYNLTAALAQRRNLYFYLGNGNDEAYLNANAGLNGGDLYAVISGWNGNDRATSDFGLITNSRVNVFQYLHAGDDNAFLRLDDLILGSTVNSYVDASAGNDQVDLSLGTVLDSRVSLRNFLSAGDDGMTARLSGAVRGNSYVSLATWDGWGNDTTTYDAAFVDVASGATLSLSSNSYQGTDTVDLTWSGDLDGRLRVLITGGMLSDDFSANLSAQLGSTGALYASMIGWWAPDNLTLNVFDNSGIASSALSVLSAYLNGGWFGSNNCTHTSNVTVVNC